MNHCTMASDGILEVRDREVITDPKVRVKEKYVVQSISSKNFC